MSKKRLAIKNVPVSVVVVVVDVVVSVDDPPGVVEEGGMVGGSVAMACLVSKIIASYARNVIARGLTRFLKNKKLNNHLKFLLMFLFITPHPTLYDAFDPAAIIVAESCTNSSISFKSMVCC
jgi:hypothetical protein